MLTVAGVRYRQVRMELSAPRCRASAQQNLTSIRPAGNHEKEAVLCGSSARGMLSGTSAA